MSNFQGSITADGKTYATQHYSLAAIIAVGYKVNSEKAVQFCSAPLKVGQMLIDGPNVLLKQLRHQRLGKSERLASKPALNTRPAILGLVEDEGGFGGSVSRPSLLTKS